MSPFAVVMLVGAVLLVAAVQFPGLIGRLSPEARRGRSRAKRKAALRIVDAGSVESDEEFVRAVERDLAALPTIDDDR